ncbi:MAG: PEP-CTERM sorting domain-containing protein [Burkholderiaceae bacterium]
MRFQIRSIAIGAALSAGLLASPAFAQGYGVYADHQADLASLLSGDVSNNAWVNLSAFPQNGVSGLTGTGGFPGSTMWAPQASQVNSSSGSVSASELGGATLNKLSNGAGGSGAYAAGSSIYYGGFSAEINNNGGTLAVVDSTPLSGLSTVVLQVGIGEAWGYDFYNHALPTLSLTTASGTTTVASNLRYNDVLEKFDNGTVDMPTGPEQVYINQYALQWDLSGYSDIQSFSVSFNGVQHAQLYGLTLTQSDTFTQVVAVPEPSVYLMMAAGLGGVAFVARRRRKQEGMGAFA